MYYSNYILRSLNQRFLDCTRCSFIFGSKQNPVTPIQSLATLRVFTALLPHLKSQVWKPKTLCQRDVQGSKLLLYFNMDGIQTFPTLTIYQCPRFYKGSIIVDGRAPLTKYKNRIYANNYQQIIQEDAPDKTSIANFTREDGFLYSLGELYKLQGFLGRGIKILICVCMYNESRNALETTLNGIYANLPALEKQGIHHTDIAVVVIQDGILKLVKDRTDRTFTKGASSVVQFYRQLDYNQGKERCHLVQRINIVLDQIDNFNRKMMEDYVSKNNDFPPSIQKNLSLVYQNYWSPTPGNPLKLKLITCFKHINGTKLSSHLWFFEGFCRHIIPHYCVLLDVGTKPGDNGIVELVKAFADESIGGCTGLMSVDSNFQSEQGDGAKASNNCFRNCFFSIEKVQQFEYIISHFIDKNAESATGFLHVLPGAWSAYRYQALIHGEKFQQNILERKYFKMILDPNMVERDHKEANMYLAEDRILSLGIYCQQQRKYILKYVPEALAYTDPMKSLEDLMKQRRRWINSSYFAFEYVHRNYYYNVMESDHNFWRRYILLPLSMLLALISFFNGYFTPAFFFFVLYTTIVQSASFPWVPYVADFMCLIYIITVFVSIGGSLLGVTWTRHAEKTTFIFSLFTYILIGLVVWNVVGVYLQVGQLSSFGDLFRDAETALVFVMTCLTLGCYLVINLVHLPTHPKFVFRLLVDALSYLAFQGAYSHIMVIYSFCNIDDVSWGTKGVQSVSNKKYLVEKVFFVANWLFYNSILAFCMIFIDFFIPRKSKKGYVLLAVGVYSTSYLALKVCLALYNHVSFYLSRVTCRRRNNEKDIIRNQRLVEFWGQ